MTAVIQVSIDGLLTGALYGMAGLAFGFLYIVMRRLDLAFGAGLMAALYVVVAWSDQGSIPIWQALAVCLPAALIALAYSQWLCFPTAADRQTLAAIAASFMVWMQFEELVTLAMPLHHYNFPAQLAWPDVALGPIVVRPDLFVLGGVALLTATLLALALSKTRLGLALRALIQQSTAARLCGVSPRKVWLTCLIVSALLGSLSAVSIAVIERAVTPMFGLTFTLKALVVIALAGTDRFVWIMVAGLVLGFIEAHAQALNGPQFREFAVYAILFAWLPVRSALSSRMSFRGSLGQRYA